MNAEKLSKLQASVRIGGKGTPRRKMKKAHKPTAADDKKLQGALKKLNAQTIPGIEEVNLFKDDGKVIHITAPRVNGAVAANTFAVAGHAEEKELTELVPGILTQLGPESIASLRKLAENLKANGQADDDEVPELVNFEETADNDQTTKVQEIE